MPNSRRTDDPAVVDPQRQYFNYIQKVTQAFVIFNARDIENLGLYDVLIAYCNTDYNGNPSVVGAIRYDGQAFPTVPIMGTDAEPLGAPQIEPHDRRVYCNEGQQIFIDLVKRTGRRFNLNNGFFWPEFYNSMVYLTEAVTSLPDDQFIPSDCNCREFDCNRYCFNSNTADINYQENPCCRVCNCETEDIYSCPGQSCPSGNTAQCPLNHNCINTEGIYCCIPVGDGGDIE